jgi:hypothetical protein
MMFSASPEKPANGRAPEEGAEVLVREVAGRGDVPTPALGEPGELVVPGDWGESVGSACAVQLGVELPDHGIGPGP